MKRRSWLGSGVRRALRGIASGVEVVLRGPRPRSDEPPGLVELLFPWPVRVALVLGSWLCAWLCAGTNIARQLGWTLGYAGVVAISLVASAWFYIFLADLVFAVVWFVLTWMKPPDPVRHRNLYYFHQAVELLNRQLSHIQTFLIWMGVLLPWVPRLTFQAPALLALALIGPALIDWITELRVPGVTRASGDLQTARRPLIYLVAVVGLVILLLRSTDQQLNLLRLVVALLLVLAVRLWRHHLRRRHLVSHRQRVQGFRRHQRRLTRRLDVVMGPVFMLLSIAGVLVLLMWARVHDDHLTRERLDGPPPDPLRCVAETGGPVDAELSMFLVADSQVHELAGRRFPGQSELADLLVPTAVRPVELDMLGTASVAELQHAFADMVRGAGSRPVYWAHLGDFADLSCTGELQRAVKTFSTFSEQDSDALAPASRARLVGIAPGNHDMSFTGNFFWSPYWTDACKSTRAEKGVSNALIGQLLDPTFGVIAEQAQVSRPERSPWWSWIAGTGGLITVTPLGAVGHPQRPVVAVFVDTSDDAAFDWGIAGLFGTYSANQDARLRQRILDLHLDHPLWIVFAHHPLGELTDRSRDRLEDTLAWLDRDPFATDAQRSTAPVREPHVLAFIAAHTHRAETHRVCIANRVIREIVIGSTIDSAQQGAVLELGGDSKGAASIRVKTVQTVARPGFTCGGNPSMIDAEDCQRIVGRLARDPSCGPLFDEGPLAAHSCSELERKTSLGDAVRVLMTSSDPVEPAEIEDAQRVRARRLMTCVCRPSSGAAPPAGRCDPVGDHDPLDDDVFATRISQRLATGGDEARKELACLSWAASAQQQHKANGMMFASALRCAFDDRTIPAAQESVATLDVQTCR